MIWSMVGGMMNAPLHRSVEITRHSSSASTRGVNTLTPPNTYVASVVMSVAMWNIGPQFR